MSSRGRFSFDQRIVSSNLSIPNGSSSVLVYSKKPSVARTSRSPGFNSNIFGESETNGDVIPREARHVGNVCNYGLFGRTCQS